MDLVTKLLELVVPETQNTKEGGVQRDLLNVNVGSQVYGWQFDL